MTFLWHLRGSVALDGGRSNEAALRRVKRLLKKQRKPVTDEGADFVAFDQPLWRNLAHNWALLVFYNQGRFWIAQGAVGRRLHYDLSSRHGFIFCSVGATVGLLAGLADRGLLFGLQLAAGLFGWLYGMNLLLAAIRVPMAVRRAVRDACGGEPQARPSPVL